MLMLRDGIYFVGDSDVSFDVRRLLCKFFTIELDLCKTRQVTGRAELEAAILSNANSFQGLDRFFNSNS